jgi:ABC-type lipoprotein release transport system permease subunit
MNKLVVGNLVHRPLRSFIVWKATLTAFVGAILGARYPAFKAANKDPINALAYE